MPREHLETSVVSYPYKNKKPVGARGCTRACAPVSNMQRDGFNVATTDNRIRYVHWKWTRKFEAMDVVQNDRGAL